MTTVDEVVRVAASHGLGPPPTPPPMLDQETVAAVLSRVDAERLIGLLDQALADGAIESDDDTAKAVGEAAVRAHAWSLLVERHHLEVHRILDDAGLDHRFLKGPTAAHRFYDHPGLRMFRDVDVLVRGEDIDRAVSVLRTRGHERPTPELIPGFDRQYGKSVTLRTDASIEVDVHRTLASGPFGVASLERLWARTPSAVTVGATDLPALDPIAAFVHACIHAVTGARTVTGTLRDVAAVAPVRGDLPEAQALATDLASHACLAEACAKASTQLDHVPGAVQTLASWPISTRDRAWLDLYHERPGYRRLAWATVRALPGPTRKARYLLALARAQWAHRYPEKPEVAPEPLT